MMSLMDDKATAEFVWARRLDTLYITLSASWGSFGIYPDKVSKI